MNIITTPIPKLLGFQVVPIVLTAAVRTIYRLISQVQLMRWQFGSTNKRQRRACSQRQDISAG